MNARWRKTMKWISTVTAGALLGVTVLFDASVAYAAEKAGEAAQPPKVRQELVQMRTENSKTYLQPDGKTYVLEQYLSPIHYKENGVWHDIDNKVESASGQKALDPELAYANKANRFRVGFAKQSKAGKLVRFKLGEAHADFRLVDGENVPAKVSGNNVTYAGVYPSTDLSYHVGSTGVKEEWVLHEYKGQSVFTMELNVKNAKTEKQKDGSISFKDGKGNTLFTIPRPVMVDAKDEVSRDIRMELRQEGGKTYLDLKADEAWLKDPKRKYPVILDPTLEIQGTFDTYDAFVSELNPTVNYGGETFLITGTHTSYGKTRTFIKFNLQPLLSGAQITSARLYLNQYATAANQQVNLYPVTSNWASSTVTWNTQPTIGSQLSSTTVGDVGEYSWDLTSLAQGWYSGTTKNYGVSLRHQVETNDRKSFRSSDYATDPTKKPKLVITYTISPLGEEEFWTTAESNVNTFNGNFYLAETDVEIPGRGVQVNVDRHYNSRSSSTGIFGYGWTSNIEQRLIDSGDGPIQYIDEDGTMHSFTPNGDGTYKTSVVKQLQLTKNADGTYVMTTADQTKFKFDTSGKLVQITDSNNNTTTIAYTGSNPTTITDASGRQVTLTYDANNRVTRVTDPANRTVEYTYNAAGDLTTVMNKDAAGNVMATVTYSYDAAHNLTGITDPNGITKTVSYNADDTVKDISSPITVNGQVQTATVSFTYDFANRLTTVTDPKGTKTLYTHNEYGNVIQTVQDPTGLNYKETFTYNTQNQLISKKDANTNAVNGSATYNYNYDTNGNLTSVTNPLGETVTATYDEKNNPIRRTDAKGYTTSNQFDAKNNRTSTTDASQKSSATEYDAYGNVTQGTASMSPGHNLAINGSFEFDRNSDNWPDDWSKVPVGSSDITWESGGLTADGVTLGTRSIKITNPTQHTAVASKRIPYNPNKTYVFSGYVKTSVPAGSNAKATIYAFGFDKDTGNYKPIPSAWITGTQGPTRLHVVINPGDMPQGTDELEIRGYVTTGSGEFWFDGLMVEEEFYGAYNILENSDFERDNDPADGIPDRWYASNKETGDGFDTTVKNTGAQSWRMNGNAGLWKTLYQDINLSGGIGTVLTVSGFSKVQNPNPSGGIYGYIIETYSGATKQETFTFNFDKSKSHDWQHIAREIKTTKAFDKVRVYYEYSLQSGTAWFDTAKVLIGSVTSKYTYDAAGNYQTRMTDPEGRTVDTTYDTVGNVKTDTVGSHTTSYDYDGLDRLTKVTDAKNGITRYEYDANGNVTKIINARNKITTYDFNEQNEFKRITDANNQSVTYEYDLNGNLNKINQPNGKTVEYGYNAVDRKTSVSHNGVQKYTFQYDPNGNLTKETDLATGRVTDYTYDAVNKVKSVQEPDGRTDYTYDKNSNVTQRKHTIGSTVITHDYGYNPLNQLTQIKANGVDHARFTYNETNRVASRKNGDGTTSLYKYNGSGNLTELMILDKNGDVVDTFKYTYDNKGNITQVVSNAGTTTYQYDELDQLVKETRPDGTIYEYTYDATGNRLTKKVTQGGSTTTITYTYDDADQLTSVNGTSYTYDENGNLVSDGNRTYVYDAENRLIQVKDSSGNTIASFTYRADGMRKTMTTASGTITFHYDENGNVTYETDQNGNVVASYTFNGLDPVSMTRGGQTYYYQLNGYGDVVALTDSNGAVVATYTYDAFGNILSQTGTVENPYRYSGYRYDKETGLYYLQQRYYNPVTGRFLTRDNFDGFEKDPLSLNKYIYVKNNPVKLFDPDGNVAIEKDAKLVKTEYDYYNGTATQIVDGVSSIICGGVAYDVFKEGLITGNPWAITGGGLGIIVCSAFAVSAAKKTPVYTKTEFYKYPDGGKREITYHYSDQTRTKKIKTTDTGKYYEVKVFDKRPIGTLKIKAPKTYAKRVVKPARPLQRPSPVLRGGWNFRPI